MFSLTYALVCLSNWGFNRICNANKKVGNTDLKLSAVKLLRLKSKAIVKCSKTMENGRHGISGKTGWDFPIVP